MKALFSTKYLSAMLKKALENKGFTTITFRNQEWVLNRHYKPDIVISAQYTRDSQNDIPKVLNIDRVQWYRISEFLDTLIEQPIVLEINDFGNNDIQVRLSQFIAEF